MLLRTQGVGDDTCALLLLKSSCEPLFLRFGHRASLAGRMSFSNKLAGVKQQCVSPGDAEDLVCKSGIDAITKYECSQNRIACDDRRDGHEVDVSVIVPHRG